MCLVTYAHSGKINLLQIIVNISFSGRLSRYGFDNCYVDLIMRRYIESCRNIACLRIIPTRSRLWKGSARAKIKIEANVDTRVSRHLYFLYEKGSGD